MPSRLHALVKWFSNCVPWNPGVPQVALGLELATMSSIGRLGHELRGPGPRGSQKSQDYLDFSIFSGYNFRSCSAKVPVDLQRLGP
ncbi:hypothetical protein TNCV_1505451 [Trichonephila clavipes]|nr:hypothetical protein TNCV_1505451 [Trichonephila clavipes]